MNDRVKLTAAEPNEVMIRLRETEAKLDRVRAEVDSYDDPEMRLSAIKAILEGKP
ncbi:MAG: hypothetical protein ACRDP6_47320 [Actinoallomurus sp.]